MITLTPDSARLLILDVEYVGPGDVGKVVELPHGAVICTSGLPVLMPPEPAE